MAGRRRSKSDSSAGSFVGILVLLAVGWVILHWKLVLCVLAFAGIAVIVFLFVKQMVEDAHRDRKATKQDQQNYVPLFDITVHSSPKLRPSKQISEKTGDASSMLVAKPALISMVNQPTEPRRNAAVPGHQIFIPRPVTKEEQKEAELQRLEAIIRS